MAKYHISDKTGKPEICSAKVRGCLYGLSEENHFKSVEEAQSAYEDKMKSQTFQKISKNVNFKKSDLEPVLSNSLDLDLLNRMISDRYILRSLHSDDDTLQILCYGRTTQYEAKWNDATKLARGLIVRTSREDFGDAVIVQRPWKKFYTLSQVESGWALGDEEEGASSAASNELDLLDFSAPAEVTDKVDGSMGVLYVAPDGKPALSTKGSFHSEQAEYYTNLLRRNDDFSEASAKLLNTHPDTTFTFELISGGEYQIVLNYEKDDISMIGAIKKSNGLYYSVSDYSDIWSKDKGLTSAESMPAKNLEEAFALPDRENREGVVVRLINDDPEKQMQIKIKQEDYLKLHKTRTAFSKKDMRALMRETKATYGDLLKISETKDISIIPEIADEIAENPNAGAQAEIFRQRRKDTYENVLLKRSAKVSESSKFIEELSDEWFEKDIKDAKRDFAKSIAKDKSKDKALLFKMFEARFHGQNISEMDASDLMRSASQEI